MSGKAMNLTLRIWRQDDAEDSGRFETHEAIDVSPDTVSYTHLTLPTILRV